MFTPTTTGSRSTMSILSATTLLALTALTIVPFTTAHSWIEEYQVIDTNGSYIGDRGYSRGYMARTDPGYNGFVMDYLVPQTGVRINATDSVCHPAQRTSNYTNPAYPKLQVQPGGYVAMKYLENGHVTLPWNQLGKPKTAGTVFVYGTTQPSDDEKMADVLAWTTDGSGGNGKGFLLTAQNFDDGRCHQINCGNISTDRQLLFPAHVEGQPSSSVEQWCETDLKIPASQPVGSLTTYWVWQWPTAPNHDCTYPDGKDEYYTTCADFEIVSPGSGNGDAKIAAEAATHTLVQENPQSTAVSDFRSRTAYTTSAELIMVSGTKTIGQSVTATAGFLSACSAGQTAGPVVDTPASCEVISVFSGAAYTSAVHAVKQYATTLPVAAATTAQATVSSSAGSTLATALPSSTLSMYTNSSTSSIGTVSNTSITYTASSTSVAPAEMTATVTVTMGTTVTQTAYATATANSAVFPTISTMMASAASEISTVPSYSSASLPATVVKAPSSPTVGAGGMVENVVIAEHNRFAEEHVARYAPRRHARHFI
ncbi:hypothetical protein LTR08_002264 [Meristemomyces frigidus]|nr:hypothetical protein LTR08_002264 [Meristemomyces frigidus]